MAPESVTTILGKLGRLLGTAKGHRLLNWDADPASGDPDGVVVALTGGSVAAGVFSDGAEILRSGLQQVPRFRDRNVHLLFLGHFAWKQPQQLMATAYLLALGGRLDMLINLDGHNEVVDTAYNFNWGVFPAYPWLWLQLSANAFPAETIRGIGEVRYLKNLRREVAAAASGSLRFVVTANLLWDVGDRYLQIRIARASNQLAAFEKSVKGILDPHTAGPDAGLRSWEELLAFSADVWEDSSRQIESLVSARGGLYFHFLQPNQYVPNSKVLTAAERRSAFDPRRDGREKSTSGVFFGYPLLLEAGERLRADGIEFHSLTEIFVGVRETIYSDTCCHTTRRGYQMMAREMGNIIVRATTAAEHQ